MERFYRFRGNQHRSIGGAGCVNWTFVDAAGRAGARPDQLLKGVGMPGTQGWGSGRMVLKVKLPKLHSASVPVW